MAKNKIFEPTEALEYIKTVKELKQLKGFIACAEKWVKYDYVFDFAEDDPDHQQDTYGEYEAFQEQRHFPTINVNGTIVDCNCFWIVRKGKWALWAGILVEWTYPQTFDTAPFNVHIGFFRRTTIDDEARNRNFTHEVRRVGFGVTLYQSQETHAAVLGVTEGYFKYKSLSNRFVAGFRTQFQFGRLVNRDGSPYSLKGIREDDQKLARHFEFRQAAKYQMTRDISVVLQEEPARKIDWIFHGKTQIEYLNRGFQVLIAAGKLTIHLRRRGYAETGNPLVLKYVLDPDYVFVNSRHDWTKRDEEDEMIGGGYIFRPR